MNGGGSFKRGRKIPPRCKRKGKFLGYLGLEAEMSKIIIERKANYITKIAQAQKA